jgi:hypothetical protein
MIAVQPNGQQAPLAATPGTAGGVGGPSASPPGGTPKNMRAQQRAPGTFANMRQQGMARPSAQVLAQQRAAAPPPAQAPAPAPVPGANVAQTNAPPVNQQALAPLLAMLQGQGGTTTNMDARAAADGALGAGGVAGAPAAAAPAAAGGAPAGAAMAGGGTAAPAAGGGGGFSFGANVGALSGPLMEQVMALLNDPTQGLNEAAQSNFDRLNRGLGREFTELREGLNENMAARGLDASTIAATELGRLGGRQAEAQSDLAARIQEQLIRDRSSAMNNAINAAMGLRGQEMDIDRDQFVINRDTGELEFRRGLDTQRLSLDAELGRGNLQLGQDRLGLDRDRFGWDQSRDLRDFDYRAGRDTINDRFRSDEFDWRRSTDARDFERLTGRDAVSDQQWTDRFNRDETWRTEDNQYRDSRDAIGDERWNRGWERDGQWRSEDLIYRDNRDAVGDNRWNRTFDQNQQNFNTNGILQLLQGMGFNNVSPEMMTSIMQSLGIPRNQIPIDTNTYEHEGTR